MMEADYVSYSIREREIIVSIIERLRLSNIIGLIEARDWIGKVFPEFEELRDTESDALFRRMANLQNGVDDEDVRVS